MSAVHLAIEDGDPEVGAAHKRWPLATIDDLLRLAEVLRAPAEDLGTPLSSFLRDVEAKFAAYCGAERAVALANGTDALWAALVGVGVAPNQGHTVIVPAVSFATGHAVLEAGATPVFCDIDPRTFQLDVGQLEGLIEPGKTRAIVVVHLHGLAVEMAPVLDIARRHGIAVVEDAAQAAGATYRDRRTGSLGDVAAFSLNVQKPWSAHDGGMVVSNDSDVIKAARLAACFGEERVPTGSGATSAHWARWYGRNSRMHPLAAALASWQVVPQPGGRPARLDEYIATAQANAAILREGLAGLRGFEPPYIPPDCTSTYHLFRIRLDLRALGWDGSPVEGRDRILYALRGERVLSAGVWTTQPLPMMTLFRRETVIPWSRDVGEVPLRPWDPSRYPVACSVLDGSVVLGRVPFPLHVQSGDLMHAYVAAFEKVVRHSDRVFGGPYEPLRVEPPIPAEDL